MRLILIVVLALTVCACKNPDNENVFTGYVEAEFVTVSAPASGWIEQQNVDYGQAVSPGSVLVQFDQALQQYQLDQSIANVASVSAQLEDAQHGARDEELAVLKSQLQEQQFNIDEAKLELERTAALRKRELATQADYDKAMLNLKALEAAAQVTSHQIEVQMLAGRPDYLESLRQQVKAAKSAEQQALWALNERQIQSRNHGVIKEIYARTGEYVTQGQPILLLQLQDTAKVRFYVSQQQLDTLSLGTNVSVHQDGLDRALKATVTYIASRAEFTPPVLYSEQSRQSLVFLVEARFEESAALHPGQPVDVTL